MMVVLLVGTAIIKEQKLPESISSLVYMFRHKWLWSVWLWIVSLCLMLPVISRLNEKVKFVGFLTFCMLAFCGCVPLFMEDKRKWHYALGIAGGILSQVCVLLIDGNWLSMWMLFVFLMGSVYVQPEGELGKAMNGKGVFVAEAVCYMALLGCVVF